MKFQKGISGNPFGRPKGRKSKVTMKAEAIMLLHDHNPLERMAMVSQWAGEMAAKEKNDANRLKYLQVACKMEAELAQYVAPKRRTVDHTGFVEHLPQTVHHSFGELPKDVRKKLKDSLKTDDQ